LAEFEMSSSLEYTVSCKSQPLKLLVNASLLKRKTTYKTTLQKPKPSEEAALKNLSFDYVDSSVSHANRTEVTVNERSAP
jgi:hypothetical protein